LRSELCSATCTDMQTILSYRGRAVSEEDVVFIRKLISDNPKASRWRLSKKLCEAWDWVQPNGHLKDMVCRGLMLQLHRAGHIVLPQKRQNSNNPFVNRKKPQPVLIDNSALCSTVSGLKPLEIVQVNRTAQESMFNSLVQMYHYLGYTHPVGEHLKYVVYGPEHRLLACFSWSSAPRHLGPRDRFIGWSAPARKKNIGYLAYNSRFLILPWVTVKNLASHLLSQMSRVVPHDWEKVYGHSIYYLETFVDPERFTGTCYRAANWKYLGNTTGRGKDDQTHKANRSLKRVLGYPLSRDFRERLSEV